jgi:sodium-coupled neutral amino acid transporter 10
LAVVSQFSIGIVATFCVVLGVHALAPERQGGAGGAGPAPLVLFNPAGAVSVLPLAIFAFGAHPAVLPVAGPQHSSTSHLNLSRFCH